MSDLTRLDIETKVALMAALLYDEEQCLHKGGAAGYAVGIAIEIEREAHRRVTEQISEKRKSVGG